MKEPHSVTTTRPPRAKSFKEELREYPRPPSTAIRNHLKRWIEYDFAKEWDAIKAACPDLEAEEFITLVTRARSMAGGLPYRRQFAVAVSERCINWHASRRRWHLNLNSRYPRLQKSWSTPRYTFAYVKISS